MDMEGAHNSLSGGVHVGTPTPDACVTEAFGVWRGLGDGLVRDVFALDAIDELDLDVAEGGL